MKQQCSHPTWWRLGLLLPLMAVLLALEYSANLSPAGHKVVQLAIILVIYGLMAHWLHGNSAALQRTSHQAGPWQRMRMHEQRTPAELPTLEGVEQSRSGTAANSEHPALGAELQTDSIRTLTKDGAQRRVWLN